jgi:tRNA pseudouridine38-40 synthase
MKVSNAPDDFHARHSAVARYYVYQISTRRTAMAKNFVWWVKDELDAKAMHQAAEMLVGKHDFSSFCETDDSGKKQSTIVNVDRAEVFVDGSLICFRIGASHFLWKMVRRIVGMLAEVGRGNLTYDAFERLLKFKSDVRQNSLPRHPDFFSSRFCTKAISQRSRDLRSWPCDKVMLAFTWQLCQIQFKQSFR